jgi:demethylmenaquinone methyltransferase/2-methoxy-6-polyprenyl-1,4-benzoquinol methylase
MAGTYRWRVPATFAAMTEFAHDKIKPFSEEGSKKDQVEQMFDRIAPRYDFMNRFLSAGIDRSWRRKAIRRFIKDKPRLLLDVATGTGDMAIMAARMLKPEKIIGIDISEKMLEIGRKKIEKEELGTKIELRAGDGETINFADNSFDGVTMAFGIRNFENLKTGLQEILRVLKPGAQLVILEFSRPVIPGVKNLYRFYMGVVAPQLAKWFSQDKNAYKYLDESARAFPDRRHFEEILKQTGYSDTEWKPISLGICCIYSGRKPKT